MRDLAADYVLDELSHLELQAFETHLDRCAECRDDVESLREIVQALRSPAPRPDLWAEVERRITCGPTFAFRSDREGWLPAPMPGVETRILAVDRDADRVTYLARLVAGTVHAAHGHAGPEECLVLSGTLQVGDTTMHPGDYQRVPAGGMHPVQSTDTGCELLLVSAAADSPLAWG